MKVWNYQNVSTKSWFEALESKKTEYMHIYINNEIWKLTFFPSSKTQRLLSVHMVHATCMIQDTYTHNTNISWMEYEVRFAAMLPQKCFLLSAASLLCLSGTEDL